MPTIYERLTAFNKNRLPDMVKLKYKAMSLNVFGFYRGTCHLFYEDLSAADPLPPSPLTWVCGDLHLENYGSFKGDDHQEYFDLNDFDEALLAPCAWEITRMLTSIVIAFDSMGVKEDDTLKIAQQFLSGYSSTLKNGKAVGLDPRTANGIVCTFLTAVQKRKQKELLKKRTQRKNGKRTLLSDNDRHFEINKPLKKELANFIDAIMQNNNYRYYDYKVQDCIFRLAGTGSIGVKRYLFLLKSMNTKNKYLFVDMKQALTSSAQPYIQIPQPNWESEAERVISVQERMQNVSPALLSPVVFKDEPYVLKQMQPTEDKINFELLKDRYNDIDKIINDMAVLTASAQLRSGGRQGSAVIDELIVYGQSNQWHGALLKYAVHYARQVKKDYQEFIPGYKNGQYQQFAAGIKN
ncbi:MAG TPA: DUF2252 family protein [Mucilaginibacter sp.]